MNIAGTRVELTAAATIFDLEPFEVGFVFNDLNEPLCLTILVRNGHVL